MAKAELKTKETEVSVADYIAAIPDVTRRADAAAIDALYRQVTGLTPRMWGPSIIGYGSYSYKYESGREGTMCRAGFSPRKGHHVFYGLLGEADEHFLAKLGKHTSGKGCLYIKSLADVDLVVLEALMARNWQRMMATYPVQAA